MRGGRRENAGRPTSWDSGVGRSETTSIRIPTYLKNQLLKIAHQLDSEEGNMNKSSQPFLSGRVPTELYNAINDHAKLTEQTRTQVMIKAVTAYLGIPTSKSPTEQKLEETEKKIEQLTQRLADLEKTIQEVQASKELPPLKDFFTDAYDKHYGKK